MNTDFLGSAVFRSAPARLSIVHVAVMAFLMMMANAAADPPAPKTVIVTPQEDLLIENTELEVAFAGTAVAPESTVAAVQWRNNAGAWQNANGTDFWNFVVTDLEVGPNLVEVRSRNAQGTNGLAVSKTITRKPTWGIACDEPAEIIEDGFYEYDLTHFAEAWHAFTVPANGLIRVESTNQVHRAKCNNGSPTSLHLLHRADSPTAAQFIVYEGQTFLFRSTRYGNEPRIGALSFSFEPTNVQLQTTCDTALEITGAGSYHFFIGGEFSNPCHPAPDPEVYKGQEWYTVWYRFTPDQDGFYEFSLRQNPTGENFSVVQTTAWFYLFPGDTCALTCGNRIPWDTMPTGGILEASAGTTYHIALTNIYVGTYESTLHGYGVLDVDYRPMQTGATCGEAIPITQSGIHPFNTLDAPASDPCRPGAKTQWFTYTAPANGVILVETCGLATFDTYVSAYSGDCPVSCASRIALNDDAAGPCGLQSRIEFGAQAGQTYRLALSGFATEAGMGEFHLGFTSMEVVVGDVIATGSLNVADVTELARRIAEGNPPPIYLADINGDGVVNQDDVQALAEMIVGKDD